MKPATHVLAVLCLIGCGEQIASVTLPSGDVGDMATAADDGSMTHDLGAPLQDFGAPTRDMAARADVSDDAAARDVAMADRGSDLVDMAAACDYRTVNDILVIQAEDLPLNEDWSVQTTQPGYTGAGYISWGGPAFNNDPTHGVMSVQAAITKPGRYQLQWYVRIGQGTNATEHNDAWVRFPDGDDFYGLKGTTGAEIRRYPKPQCDDEAFTTAIEALPDVTTADCSRGSTTGGWLKVYSSGATDWRWSTFTSDNDGSRIMVEFDSAGTYTLQVSARADLFLIDRLVLHHEDIADADARDLGLPPTNCP